MASVTNTNGQSKPAPAPTLAAWLAEQATTYEMLARAGSPHAKGLAARLRDLAEDARYFSAPTFSDLDARIEVVARYNTTAK